MVQKVLKTHRKRDKLVDDFDSRRLLKAKSSKIKRRGRKKSRLEDLITEEEPKYV